MGWADGISVPPSASPIDAHFKLHHFCLGNAWVAMTKVTALANQEAVISPRSVDHMGFLFRVGRGISFGLALFTVGGKLTHCD